MGMTGGVLLKVEEKKRARESNKDRNEGRKSRDEGGQGQ